MIGGKVLDSSALVALIRGRLSAVSWFAVAGSAGLVFYVPSLAVTEARVVYPDAGPLLAELLSDPAVVLGELDEQMTGPVARLLDDAGVFDALAGHVVHVARTRGWPVLTDDPGRLHRVDAGLEVELL